MRALSIVFQAAAGTFSHLRARGRIANKPVFFVCAPFSAQCLTIEAGGNTCRGAGPVRFGGKLRTRTPWSVSRSSAILSPARKTIVPKSARNSPQLTLSSYPGEDGHQSHDYKIDLHGYRVCLSWSGIPKSGSLSGTGSPKLCGPANHPPLHPPPFCSHVPPPGEPSTRISISCNVCQGQCRTVATRSCCEHAAIAAHRWSCCVPVSSVGGLQRQQQQRQQQQRRLREEMPRRRWQAERQSRQPQTGRRRRPSQRRRNALTTSEWALLNYSQARVRACGLVCFWVAGAYGPALPCISCSRLLTPLRAVGPGES